MRLLSSDILVSHWLIRVRLFHLVRQPPFWGSSDFRQQGSNVETISLLLWWALTSSDQCLWRHGQRPTRCVDRTRILEWLCFWCAGTFYCNGVPQSLSLKSTGVAIQKDQTVCCFKRVASFQTLVLHISRSQRMRETEAMRGQHLVQVSKKDSEI